MANQFYVGQPLWAIDPCIMENGKYANKPSLTVGKKYVNQSDNGIFITDDHGDGHSFSSKDRIRFFSIDQPRNVLTDWHRKQLKDIGYTDNFIAKIESILSKPEPPKYVPKEGEAVLYESNIWMAGVFTNMVKGKFRIASGNSTFCVDRVIPFDSSLHGSNVND